MNTFVDILERRLITHHSKVAYIFLLDGDSKEQTITFGKLIEKVKMLAQKIGSITEKGDRILLLYPPGLEYIIAFYACLYKGLIAVPAYPPNTRNIARVNSIIKDSKAKVALCSKEVYENVMSDTSDNDYKDLDTHLQWIFTDVLHENSSMISLDTHVDADDIAFLQYTSGSTSDPKGVMVTHSNLLANSQLIKEYCQLDESCVKVSWLPPYHDMGLIGSIIQPFYSGMTGILMSPTSFLKRPVRWLKAITQYKELGPIISGGPNFSYKMCCNYIPDNQLHDIDLSGWQIVYNGAEPVRAGTLKRFWEKFRSSGFKYYRFYPLYGLAEATLMASAGDLSDNPVIKKYDALQLEKNNAVELSSVDTKYAELVGCGKNLANQKIAIVNPETYEICNEKEVGEIWMKGPSIAKGYWQNEKETDRIFHAYIKSTGEGPFLRTGDLGFLDEEELFVTGRVKELIIIRGHNYYPQDIEETVEKACEALRPGCGAAFSITNSDEEKLVIVYELSRKFMRNANLDKIKSTMKESIFNKYGLTVYDIVIIEPSSFPKTTSGKLQRQIARHMYLTNKHHEIVESRLTNSIA